MARLVGRHNGEVLVVQGRIISPTFSLFVKDYSNSTAPPAGWVYYDRDITIDEFAPDWKQPIGPDTAYALGAVVVHNGTRYRSALDGNVWEPGVSGWHAADSDIPTYVASTGAHDAYKKGAVVRYNNKIWENIVDNNVFAPGVSGWRESYLVAPDAPPPAPPAWVQPTGAHDAYQIGNKVTHNGSVWTCTVANNVWEPGVYGWTNS